MLAAGHRQEILVDYFQGRYTDWNVDIVDTGESSDTGERIRRCASRVGDAFFATYGDGLGNVDLNATYTWKNPGLMFKSFSVQGSIFNLLNSQKVTLITPAGGPLDQYEWQPPRSYMVTLRAVF